MGSTAGVANGLNQLTSVGGTAAAHDGRGNVLNDPYTGKTYTYSSENLLTSASGGVTLAYDPAMRLFQLAGASTTRFAYDGVIMIAEYNGSDALQRRFVFGPGVDEPLVKYEGSDTSVRSWFHGDERGSIIAISDASGNATTINKYDEYGKPQTGNVGRFQYTGQIWLPELGAYYYKARIYSPTLGRFLQTDPIRYAGGLNLYAYVLNDPINFIDPLGLRWRRICAGVEGHEVCGWHWVSDGSGGLTGGGVIHPGTPTGPGTGSAPGPGNGNGNGNDGDDDDQCAVNPGDEFLTQEDAALAAAQWERAQQDAARDNNERSFRLTNVPGGLFSFQHFAIGSPFDVPLPGFGSDFGSGHVHTDGGGSQLSTRLGLYDRNRDVQNIGRIVNVTGNSNFMSVLAGENGRVYTWSGKRNLTSPGKDIGSDTCE